MGSQAVIKVSLVDREACRQVCRVELRISPALLAYAAAFKNSVVDDGSLA